MLRSVVLPLEEEITMLKTKLRDSKDYADNLKIKVSIKSILMCVFKSTVEPALNGH